MHLHRLQNARFQTLIRRASPGTQLISATYSRFAGVEDNSSAKQSIRLFTQSAYLCSDQAARSKLKNAASDYNVRRAKYKKQVSELRKEYAAEVKAQIAADEAQKAAERKEVIRQKLERQRLKNIRSAQNAILEKEKRERRHQEWQEELLVEQVKREKKAALMTKARQLLVDELEEEAPLWLTTPEEVEAAFSPETEQRLWTYPNSVIGAPDPSGDADFWRYESHTWHMDKTYPTRSDILTEKLQEMTYEETNIDRDYWTDERLEEYREMQEKAKLRAMVRDEGRRVLLQKQKELLQDTFTTKKGSIPKASPVPNVGVLANVDAMEKEGAKILLNDPTKFFEFEQAASSAGAMEDGDDSSTDSLKYGGPTLGAPIGLKDPIRSPQNNYQPFPTVVGKLPKPDLRTEKEKRRAERQEAMWAAAQGGADGEQKQVGVEFMADDEFESGAGEPLDYEKLSIEYDSDEEEWTKGLDPETEQEIIKTPKSERYTDADIDLVIKKIEKKIEHLEEQLLFDLESVQQELLAEREAEEGEMKRQSEEVNIEDSLGQVGEKTEGIDDSGESFVQYRLENGEELDLQSIGVDVGRADEILRGLSEEQMLALMSLNLDSQSLSTEDMRNALETVPGLSKDQITNIVDMEQALAQNDDLKQHLNLKKTDEVDEDN
mmetsp:Transcript_21128/g.29848  ORF Transcript_21128/g.29848 Transcript_21128/m.29848 type:complete len:663 (+) Transcript_21128:135-2123(+)